MTALLLEKRPRQPAGLFPETMQHLIFIAQLTSHFDPGERAPANHPGWDWTHAGAVGDALPNSRDRLAHSTAGEFQGPALAAGNFSHPATARADRSSRP